MTGLTVGLEWRMTTEACYSPARNVMLGPRPRRTGFGLRVLPLRGDELQRDLWWNTFRTAGTRRDNTRDGRLHRKELAKN